MSMKIVFLIIILAMFGSSEADAAIVTIDPDNFLNSTDISTATVGVTVSSVPHAAPTTRDPIFATDWFTAIGNIFASPANSTIVFGFETFPETRDAVFRADFDVPTDFVSLLSVVASDQNFMSLRAFDAGNNLLATVDAPGIRVDFTATINRSSADIAYILAGGTNPLAGNGIDRFEFNRILPPPPVAMLEPTTLLLLGLGLAGLGFARKRLH